MGIGNRQEFGATIGKPLRACKPLALGAVPVATAIVGDADLAAVFALLDMPTERRSAAASMATIARRWSINSRMPWAAQNASPWWRKISATSILGRICVGYSGATKSRENRSKVLDMAAIRFVAICA